MVEFKIISQQNNKVIGRKEIIAELPFQGPTPSLKDVQNWLAKDQKVDSKQVIVHHVYTKFGVTKAVVHARIYDSSDTAKFLEKIEEVKPKEVKTEAPKEETAAKAETKAK
ncbi:hypothetical protein HYV79_03810 [Candidatus Woesearchaeota archaeon]|nr:hypothetical protein [Candidatus Woesearchaeota archaeon]